MPETIGSITVPCATEAITPLSFFTFATGVESMLSGVRSLATKALLRPAAVVRNDAGTAYTAGVAVVPSFQLELMDTDSMFTLASPTILTVNTAGTYLLSLKSSTNMASTNTAHKAEILVNGTTVSTAKSGSGITGNQAAGPLPQSILVPSMIVGDQISCRITISGVGNDSTFPLMSAVLVSYGV